MNALEQEYRDNIERSRLQERRRSFLLVAIPWTLAMIVMIVIASRFWDAVVFVIGALFAILNWVGYASVPRCVVTNTEPEQPETQPERGYRSPMFMYAPVPPPRTFAERLGSVVGAWRNRRNTQRMIEWERRLEEKTK